jgi:hypothetical protein
LRSMLQNYYYPSFVGKTIQCLHSAFLNRVIGRCEFEDTQGCSLRLFRCSRRARAAVMSRPRERVASAATLLAQRVEHRGRRPVGRETGLRRAVQEMRLRRAVQEMRRGHNRAALPVRAADQAEKPAVRTRETAVQTPRIRRRSVILAGGIRTAPARLVSVRAPWLPAAPAPPAFVRSMATARPRDQRVSAKVSAVEPAPESACPDVPPTPDAPTGQSALRPTAASRLRVRAVASVPLSSIARARAALVDHAAPTGNATPAAIASAGRARPRSDVVRCEPADRFHGANLGTVSVFSVLPMSTPALLMLWRRVRDGPTVLEFAAPFGDSSPAFARRRLRCMRWPCPGT